MKKWLLGDRVAANYALAHIAGDSTPEIQQTALGGALDGVLTEYQVFPEYVRLLMNLSSCYSYPRIVTSSYTREPLI